ncbi:MAG: hypothetical protein LH480_09960 [Rubrivivax sp.]|nr:hypothetical protein [Rubrivivax sp.]
MPPADQRRHPDGVLVQACAVPAGSLLAAYARRGYTDCYVTSLTGATAVSHPAFVEAFYTTALFKTERAGIRWMLGRPSTDLQARELGGGTADAFAAWSVEARAADEILLCDIGGSTRSWLMVRSSAGGVGDASDVGGVIGANVVTQLFFGSAVVAKRGPSGLTLGKQNLGWIFHALLGFHKLYSRLLLGAARKRLSRDR